MLELLKVLDSALQLLRGQQVMGQDEMPKYFADGPRALLAVSDACMRNAGLVETKEVRILCDQYSTCLAGERQLLLVGDGYQTNLGRARHINAAAPQTGGHAQGDVLIQVKANAHRQEAFLAPAGVSLAANSEGLWR